MRVVSECNQFEIYIADSPLVFFLLFFLPLFCFFSYCGHMFCLQLSSKSDDTLNIFVASFFVVVVIFFDSPFNAE